MFCSQLNTVTITQEQYQCITSFILSRHKSSFQPIVMKTLRGVFEALGSLHLFGPSTPDTAMLFTTLPSKDAVPSRGRSSPQVEYLEPGLVVIRGLVDDEGCERLAQSAFDLGKHEENGFFTDSGELNTGEAGRGRIYDCATRFPAFVLDHCRRAVRMARKHDSAMPRMRCTHILLNMYTNSDGLVWHRDIYENDGRSNNPVVNLCVGASCSFGYKHKDEDEEKILTLRSGDCLLFGGPCRLIKHAILDVDLQDCPKWMTKSANPVRFSFTFRDSPEVLGREEEFKYFRVDEHLVGQRTFESGDHKNWKALPSHYSQRNLVTS